MPDPSSFRDSTQIVLPVDALEGLCADIEEEFTVTVFTRGDVARIIGSPVVIKDVNDFLARQGVSVP